MDVLHPRNVKRVKSMKICTPITQKHKACTHILYKHSIHLRVHTELLEGNHSQARLFQLCFSRAEKECWGGMLSVGGFPTIPFDYLTCDTGTNNIAQGTIVLLQTQTPWSARLWVTVRKHGSMSMLYKCSRLYMLYSAVQSLVQHCVIEWLSECGCTTEWLSMIMNDCEYRYVCVLSLWVNECMYECVLSVWVK